MSSRRHGCEPWGVETFTHVWANRTSTCQLLWMERFLSQATCTMSQGRMAGLRGGQGERLNCHERQSTATRKFKVKKWLLRRTELCLHSHTVSKRHGEGISRPQTQLTGYHAGRCVQWPGWALWPQGRTVLHSVVLKRMDFKWDKLSVRSALPLFLSWPSPSIRLPEFHFIMKGFHSFLVGWLEILNMAVRTHLSVPAPLECPFTAPPSHGLLGDDESLLVACQVAMSCSPPWTPPPPSPHSGPLGLFFTLCSLSFAVPLPWSICLSLFTESIHSIVLPSSDHGWGLEAQALKTMSQAQNPNSTPYHLCQLGPPVSSCETSVSTSDSNLLCYKSHMSSSAQSLVYREPWKIALIKSPKASPSIPLVTVAITHSCDDYRVPLSALERKLHGGRTLPVFSAHQQNKFPVE